MLLLLYVCDLRFQQCMKTHQNLRFHFRSKCSVGTAGRKKISTSWLQAMDNCFEYIQWFRLDLQFFWVLTVAISGSTYFEGKLLYWFASRHNNSLSFSRIFFLVLEIKIIFGWFCIHFKKDKRQNCLQVINRISVVIWF